MFFRLAFKSRNHTNLFKISFMSVRFEKICMISLWMRPASRRMTLTLQEAFL